MDKQTEKNLKTEIKELKKLNRLMDGELDIVHKYLTKFYNYTPGMDDEPVVIVKECLAKIDKLYEKSEELKSMDWISVKERLPEIGEEVIVWHTGLERRIIALALPDRYFKVSNADGSSIHYSAGQYNITHWQPLPDKPGDVA
jgi:hypothetical protein